MSNCWCACHLEKGSGTTHCEHCTPEEYASTRIVDGRGARLTKEQINKLKNTSYNEGFQVGYECAKLDVLRTLRDAARKRAYYLKVKKWGKEKLEK